MNAPLPVIDFSAAERRAREPLSFNVDPAAVCAWRCISVAERIRICEAAGVPEAVDCASALELSDAHRAAIRALFTGRHPQYNRWSATAGGLSCL